MLVPINLTSSGSHPAWKKVSLLYSPKRIRVRLNNKSFQFVTQMKNIKTKKKKEIKQNFHHVYHRHPSKLAQGQRGNADNGIYLERGIIILT